jgi:hypothetical protein
MFKLFSKIFKVKSEPVFTASIQRVPSTQVSLDTSGFYWLTGNNVFDGFQSLDNGMLYLSGQIHTIDIPNITLLQETSGYWDSTYTTVQSNSADFWDNTELSARTLNTESSAIYLESQIVELYTLNATTSAITLLSATNLVESLSTAVDVHISDSTIHFAQSSIDIPHTQISDWDTSTQDFLTEVDLTNPYSTYTSIITYNDTSITLSPSNGDTILFQPSGTTGTITIDFDSNWSSDGVSTLVTVFELSSHSVSAIFDRIDENLWSEIGSFTTGFNSVVWAKFATGKWQPYRGDNV